MPVEKPYVGTDRLWPRSIVLTGLGNDKLRERFTRELDEAPEEEKIKVFDSWVKVAKSLIESWVTCQEINEQMERGEDVEGLTDVTDWVFLNKKRIEQGLPEIRLRDWLDQYDEQHGNHD